MVFVLSRRDNMGCMWFYFGSDNILTVGFGFGMLAVGLIAITIGAIVAYIIINKVCDESNTDN